MQTGISFQVAPKLIWGAKQELLSIISSHLALSENGRGFWGYGDELSLIETLFHNEPLLKYFLRSQYGINISERTLNTDAGNHVHEAVCQILREVFCLVVKRTKLPEGRRYRIEKGTWAIAKRENDIPDKESHCTH